ncbi:three-Cys-motif partner protein TcmP [Martelella sp. FLE1502]
MSKVEYDWENGAELKEHTSRKLKVLKEYFEQYLKVRCRIPQQYRFKLAIVDGFAGGGRYKNGEPGSPIVFVETLVQLSNEINIQRSEQGMAPLEFACLLILNDADTGTVSLLQENMSPVLAAAKEGAPHLVIRVRYLNKRFEEAYPEIKAELTNERIKNVLFNLDQCGDAMVGMPTLHDIMKTFHPTGEIFLTFMIKSLLAFLHRSNPIALEARLQHLNIKAADLAPLDGLLSKNEWLGTAEKIVFDAFQGCAPFVSTFSLNNPDGWRYWLIHFSNVPRARQVYNDILHANASHQAHFGRSGLVLNMFAFDPDRENSLYFFEGPDRKRATNELADDIPRLVEVYGDAMEMGQFYQSAYNLTPAHSEDIKRAMFINPDLEVLTPTGNVRRKSHKIEIGDTLRIKNQKSFHILWKDNDR